MISIIITAYKESQTIGRAIEQVLKNNLKNYEIIVVAPDKETIDKTKEYAKKNKKIRVVIDEQKGKPAALNLAVSKSNGEILILSDGDVYVDDTALVSLIEQFKDERIGAVSGNPISLNPKNRMFSFWAYLLTNVANENRIKAAKVNRRFFCSGYLFAIRKKLFPNLPEELLSEDGYISNAVYEKGSLIAYSEKSRVYIKYPTNFKDWIIQKKRSVGGYNQIRKMKNVEIRSFKQESFGAVSLLKYANGIKELFWLSVLFLARIYLWIKIYLDINIKKKSSREIWKRVESTK